MEKIAENIWMLRYSLGLLGAALLVAHGEIIGSGAKERVRSLVSGQR